MEAAASAAWMAAVAPGSEEEETAAELIRRGPWAEEEDALLAGYVAAHGEGRWNEVARGAGLRRTGKSCRLRWLNYLRPDVRRGGFTPQEQLLILELHLRWGNRWSRIAQQLPGRTDNEVKNYWRTRVQKHARHLNCDANSSQFHDVVRHIWLPRLLERIHAVAPTPAPAVAGIAPNDTASGSDVCHSPETTTTTTTTSSTAGSFSTLSPSSDQLGAVAAGSEQWGSCAGACSSDDDMFDGSWSELLARACNDGADSVVLPDFEFGESSSTDNWWNLKISGYISSTEY